MNVALRWAPSVAAGLAVFALFLAELNNTYVASEDMLSVLAFCVFGAVAVGAARNAPAVGLAAAWAAGLAQLVGGIPILMTELAFTVVLFCAARWGSTLTLLLSGATVALVPLLALGWMRSFGIEPAGGRLVLSVLGLDTRSAISRSFVVLGAALLGVPWLSGLSLRFLARAQAAQEGQESAEIAAAQAREIAQLREEQNRLARDVHDVVGHSLAVILAQAESAQFIDDAEPVRLKQTMANIATSARTSLRDVRNVLSPDLPAATPHGIDNLLDGVRSSGQELVVEQLGQPRPLPPELEQVAYRVLQEMLTNAIKYGVRGRPLDVELAWPEGGELGDSLRIEVRNVVDAAVGEDTSEAAAQGAGQGLAGMRRRLLSVGGHLDVRRRELEDASTFTATAWVPVRDEGAGGTDERE